MSACGCNVDITMDQMRDEGATPSKDILLIGRWKRCPLHEAAPILLAALEQVREAIGTEFLYQTGQTVRPEHNYPPQGTVCGELFDAQEAIVNAIKEASDG